MRPLMRTTAVLLGLLVLGGAAAARDDVAGWDATRWGMTEAEIESALGERVVRLPGRWLYGNAYADLAVEDVDVGGLQFTAYLQMNAESHRLQQVLLTHLKAHVLRAREYLPPRFPHLRNSGDARAAGMHAIDLVVVRPYGHHRFEVLLGERFVERGFGILRRRKKHFLHGPALVSAGWTA